MQRYWDKIIIKVSFAQNFTGTSPPALSLSDRPTLVCTTLVYSRWTTRINPCRLATGDARPPCCRTIAVVRYYAQPMICQCRFTDGLQMHALMLRRYFMRLFVREREKKKEKRYKYL